MRRPQQIGLFLALAVAAVAAAPGTVATAGAAAPETIPALRSWQPQGPGHFRLTRRSRIVLGRPAGRALRTTARLLAGDIHRLLGFRPRVIAGRGGAMRKGDLRVNTNRRRAGSGLGREGYRLRVGRRVRIKASRPAGTFYGTRTILQLLAHRRRIPFGRAVDSPLYRQRGLMVDVGRQYFTPRWLRQHVRELAFLKLNLLHLHLSDDEGFRIESRSHPEAVTEPALNRRQVRAIVRIAKRHRIEVVPEIDMPGHMTAALAQHPELQLVDRFGRRQPDKLDVTKPAARRFARDLIEEYLPLFPGRYWHVGADEYLGIAPLPDGPGPDPRYAQFPQLEAYAESKYGAGADGHDAVDDFVEFVRRIVERHGKTLRMWHDGLDLANPGAVQVDTDVIAEWWIDLTGPSPEQLAAAGYRVINGGWFPTYYVQGPLATIRPDNETAYESWDPTQFQGPFVCQEELQNTPDRLAADDPKHLGTKLHVWNDVPGAQTGQQIAAGISMRLRMIAQKAWGSKPLFPDYASFLKLADRIGHAPGFDVSGGPPSRDDARDCGS